MASLAKQKNTKLSIYSIDPYWTFLTLKYLKKMKELVRSWDKHKQFLRF